LLLVVLAIAAVGGTACVTAERAVQAAPAPGASIAPPAAAARAAPAAGPNLLAPASETEEATEDASIPDPALEPAALPSREPSPPPPPASTTAVAPLGEGWRVRIPDIGVDAAMVSVGYDADGAMGAPEGPEEVGWFRYGVAPGQPGNTLLDGHVDWTDRRTGIPRGGVFWNLARLQTGSLISVEAGGREYTYAVTEKRRYRWDDPDGITVLQPTGDTRVTLITCGGVFDRRTRNYSMRDVVIAHLVS
jgi:sortase (surface protein transpeptidase)